MNRNNTTDDDEKLNTNDAWEQQKDETEEEYGDRINDWGDIIDILNGNV